MSYGAIRNLALHAGDAKLTSLADTPNMNSLPLGCSGVPARQTCTCARAAQIHTADADTDHFLAYRNT